MRAVSTTRLRCVGNIAVSLFVLCCLSLGQAEDSVSPHSLSLQWAIRAALEKSPEVILIRERFSSALMEKKKASSGFWPVLRSKVLTSETSSPSIWETDTGGGSFLITEKNFQVEGGIYQLLPTGGEFFTRFSNQQWRTSSSNALISPYYSSMWEFGITQPLLRGYDWFGSHLGDNWTELLIARQNENRSTWGFMRELGEYLSKIEVSYRSLYRANKIREARKRALQSTEKQLEIVKNKIEAGLLVQGDLYQVEEKLESRRGLCLASDQQYDREKHDFAATVGLIQDSSWLSQEWDLAPLEPVLSSPIHSQDFAKTLLEKNYTLQELAVHVDAKRMAALRAKNLCFPDLQVSGSMFLTGGNTPTAPSFSDNIDELFNTDSHGWDVQVMLEVPLGPSPERYEYQLARLSYHQARREFELERNKLMAEILPLSHELRVGKELMDTAQRTVTLAEKKLDFEQRRFLSGLTTNFSLLQFQEDLMDAQVKAVEATFDYERAIVRWDFLQGNIFQRHGIQVVRQDEVWDVRQPQ